MNEHKIVMLQLSDLKPADYNPRKELQPGDAEYEKIKNSLERFGYVDPIIVNSDMTIIGGHQRYNVMMALGYIEANCVVVDLNKNDEKALNVALNKITGEWDDEALKSVFADLQLEGYDLSFTGFDADEIEDLMIEIDIDDVEPVEDSAPEPREDVTVVRGDIYQLGRHRLMCGDSTNINDVEKLLDGAEMDLCVTDPPYNVAIENAQGLTIENDDMDDIEFLHFLESAFYCLSKALKLGGGVLYMVCHKGNTQFLSGS